MGCCVTTISNYRPESKPLTLTVPRRVAVRDMIQRASEVLLPDLVNIVVGYLLPDTLQGRSKSIVSIQSNTNVVRRMQAATQCSFSDPIALYMTHHPYLVELVDKRGFASSFYISYPRKTQVGSACISDGHMFLFSRVQSQYDRDEKSSNLLIIKTDTGAIHADLRLEGLMAERSLYIPASQQLWVIDHRGCFYCFAISTTNPTAQAELFRMYTTPVNVPDIELEGHLLGAFCYSTCSGMAFDDGRQIMHFVQNYGSQIMRYSTTSHRWLSSIVIDSKQMGRLIGARLRGDVIWVHATMGVNAYDLDTLELVDRIPAQDDMMFDHEFIHMTVGPTSVTFLTKWGKLHTFE